MAFPFPSTSELSPQPLNVPCGFRNIDFVNLYKVRLEIAHSGEPAALIPAAPYWTERPLRWTMRFYSGHMPLEIPGTSKMCITRCTCV